MISFCAHPILSAFSPCFSPLRAGSIGRGLSEETREERKFSKMKGGVYVYDSLDIYGLLSMTFPWCLPSPA